MAGKANTEGTAIVTDVPPHSLPSMFRLHLTHIVRQSPRSCWTHISEQHSLTLCLKGTCYKKYVLSVDISSV
jgi:hypothetical protein